MRSYFSQNLLDIFVFQARDECITQNGEAKCGYLIEAHKKCLRDHGFEVEWLMILASLYLVFRVLLYTYSSEYL